MARLIMKSPYFKPNRTSDLSGYVKYIATRENVQQADDTSMFRPAYMKQKKLIESVTGRHPEAASLPEYGEYANEPNRLHADRFLIAAAERYGDQTLNGYVSYIATRPSAQKLASHGLFTDEGIPVSLEQAAREVAAHQGNVWTHIISLRREDAARLGYDSARDWMTLLRAKRNVFARNMNIRPENFRWYAAFHNEGTHPHVHMIAYSKDPHEAYLTRKGIESIKRELAQDIFRHDLLFAYERQTGYRDELRQRAKQLLENLAGSLKNGAGEASQIEKLLPELAVRLANTKAKKVYGYQKKDVKDVIDRIVDLLESDSRISELYELWYRQRCEIFRTYTDTMPDKTPLSECPEFKPVKNAVIKAAMSLIRDCGASRKITQADLAGADTVRAAAMLIADLSRLLEQEIEYNDRALADLDSKEREKIEEKLAAHGLKHG